MAEIIQERKISQPGPRVEIYSELKGIKKSLLMASQEITNTLENRLNKFSHFSHWPSSMFTAVVGSKSFRFKLILVLRIFYKSYDTQETKLLVYDLLTINCFLTQFLLGKQYTAASDTSGLATRLDLASRVPVDVTHTSSNRSIECLACDGSIPLDTSALRKSHQTWSPIRRNPGAARLME